MAPPFFFYGGYMEEAERLERIEDSLKRAGLNYLPDAMEYYLSTPDILEQQPSMYTSSGYSYCRRCSKWKKLYLFYASSRHKSGFSPECKQCRNARKTARYQNADDATKEKIKAQYKKYRKTADQNKKERIQQAIINGTYVPKEKTEKDLIKEQRRLARNAAYRKTDAWKEVYRRSAQKREELKKANKGIPYTKKLIKQRDEGHPCILCGKPIEDGDSVQVDHLIPVLIGGADCFSNVSFVHASCNHRKTKTALEITTAQIEELRIRTETFMDNNKELFK